MKLVIFGVVLCAASLTFAHPAFERDMTRESLRRRIPADPPMPGTWRPTRRAVTIVYDAGKMVIMSMASLNPSQHQAAMDEAHNREVGFYEYMSDAMAGLVQRLLTSSQNADAAAVGAHAVYTADTAGTLGAPSPGGSRLLDMSAGVNAEAAIRSGAITQLQWNHFLDWIITYYRETLQHSVDATGYRDISDIEAGLSPPPNSKLKKRNGVCFPTRSGIDYMTLIVDEVAKSPKYSQPICKQ